MYLYATYAISYQTTTIHVVNYEVKLINKQICNLPLAINLLIYNIPVHGVLEQISFSNKIKHERILAAED